MPEVVVLSEPAAGVTLVTLNRPERLNALNAPLLQELSTALDMIAQDAETRVVILTGEGRGFCAGADLQGYDESDDADFDANAGPVEWWHRQRAVADLVERLHRLPQPVIAAVNGAAAGGGMALACASDVRFAATTAVFKASFISAGYSGCDMGLSWFLPRIVGTGHAHELMLTGRRVEIDEAARIGLVTRVVPPNELIEAAVGLALEMTSRPPLSLMLTKQAMWLSLEASSLRGAMELENRQQVMTAMTQDRREATAAFLERRPPSYSGH